MWGTKLAYDVVREEAWQPSLPLTLAQKWNALRAAVGTMAQVAWKDNIILMLSECRKCWVYKVLAFAYRYEGNTDRFNPDDQCPDGASELGARYGHCFPNGPSYGQV